MLHNLCGLVYCTICDSFCDSFIFNYFLSIIVMKSHSTCLNSWSEAYIFVGKLSLMSIWFKMKFDMALGPIARLLKVSCSGRHL